MAGTASAGRGGAGRGGYGLRAQLAVGVVTLGCVATLALGGLPVGKAAGADPWATAWPTMLAVDDQGCVYASGEGTPRGRMRPRTIYPDPGGRGKRRVGLCVRQLRRGPGRGVSPYTG